MRLRTFLLAISVGTVLAVLPAMASSETAPTVEAVATGQSGGIYSHETFAWAPTQRTVAAGGAVQFSTGSTEAPHGIVWTSAEKPTCSSSVPVGATSYAEHWSGSCTFSQPGTYTFHCSVHTTEMTGTITVTAAGTTTTTTSTPTPTPIVSPTPTTPTTTTPAPTPKPTVSRANAKKLAKALKACRRKAKNKRAACIKRAHRRYGPRKA